MLRAGAIVLSLWTGFNLVLALTIVVTIVGFGQNAPALLILFGSTTGTEIESRALATINALAVMFNAGAVTACGLGLAIIWRALVRRERWAFWILLGFLGFLQAAGFASDSFLGNENLIANIASTVLLLVGLGFAGLGVYTRPQND